MYSHNKQKAKVGKVTIDITGNRYRLRFTHPKGQRQQFKIIGEISDDTWALALQTASLVNRDIALDDVDFTYGRYSAYRASSLKIAQKEPNIKEIWRRYKELKKSSIAQTTQNNLWKDCDRYLSRVDDKLLELNKAQEFLAHLQTKYAVSTIATLFRSCLNPAINLAVEAELITKNPFDKIKIPKPQKKNPECYEPQEIREIIKAFYNDAYKPKSSGYAHSHYAHYVELMALTGARPEELVPLTWNDIKRKGGNTYIRFSKAYSKGILLPHTKTHEIRLFKCNKQLTRLLDSIKKHENSNLLLNAVRGGYLNHNNFREDNWRVVIKGLVKDGKLHKYLRPYSLRHSFVTRLIREGTDIKTVASLSGHSVKTLLTHYLVSRDDFDIPEL